MWINGLMEHSERSRQGLSPSRSHVAVFQNSGSLPISGRRGGRVVYCGGLENRFGFTADGGSNPSLSANS